MAPTRTRRSRSTSTSGVLANDNGTAPLTAVGASDPPTNGVVTLDADGSFTYTPDAGFSGTDTFTYQAANGAGTDTATVTITVNEVLLPAVPPTAVDDSYSTDQDTTLTATAATGVLANDIGSQPMDAGGASDPPNGSVTMNVDGSFTYTPTAGFTGTDTFTYQVSSVAGTDTANVTITVQPPPNQPPVAGNDTFTTPQDTPLTITAAAVRANDSDPDGDPLRFASPLPLTNPRHGTITGSGGVAIYTPDAGFRGIDTFTYAISDGTDNSAAATIRIAVTRARRRPTPTAAARRSSSTPAAAERPAARRRPGDRGLPGPGRHHPPRRPGGLPHGAGHRPRAHPRQGERQGQAQAQTRRAAQDQQQGRTDPDHVRVICRTDDGEVLGQAERRLPCAPSHAWILGPRPRDPDRDRPALRQQAGATTSCAGHDTNPLRRPHRQRPRGPRQHARALTPAGRARRRELRQRSLAQSPASSRTPARTRSRPTRLRPVALPTAASPSRSCTTATHAAAVPSDACCGRWLTPRHAEPPGGALERTVSVRAAVSAHSRSSIRSRRDATMTA